MGGVYVIIWHMLNGKLWKLPDEFYPWTDTGDYSSMNLKMLQGTEFP